MGRAILDIPHSFAVLVGGIGGSRISVN